MLIAKPRVSEPIIQGIRQENTLLLLSQAGTIRVIPMSDCAVRMICTRSDEQENCKFDQSRKASAVQWTFTDDDQSIFMRLANLTIKIDKKSASISYYKPDGTCLLKERDRDSRTMESFQSYRVEQAGRIEHIQTADGVKTFVKDAVRVPDKQLYHTRMHFEWQDGEALYGLGQHEEGILNLRGHCVYLHQANRKIAIPPLVSSLGYGILMIQPVR